MRAPCPICAAQAPATGVLNSSFSCALTLSPLLASQGSSAVAGGTTLMILLIFAALSVHLLKSRHLTFCWSVPKYDLLRRKMWRRLEAAMAPGPWNALRQMPNSIMAVKLLDCDYVGGSNVADVIAPFVYACWQLRWKVRNEESRSDERGADGSDAMA